MPVGNAFDLLSINFSNHNSPISELSDICSVTSDPKRGFNAPWWGQEGKI